LQQQDISSNKKVRGKKIIAPTRYQQQQEGEGQEDNCPFLEDAGIDPAT